MEVILPLLGLSFLELVIFGITIILSFPYLQGNGFIYTNIDSPIGFMCLSGSIIIAMIMAGICYNFLIPVFIITGVIGYLIAIKQLPKFVLSQSKKVQNAIHNSISFPYYATIILSVTWPIFLIINFIHSIFSILDLNIETPKKSIQRALNSNNGD